jgi:predicted nucleic acid-binding protein
MVIADISPLHYLILIDHADLLTKLYGKIVIPEAVRRELQARGTPDVVKRWMAVAPQWVEVHHLALGEDTALRGLDPGERERLPWLNRWTPMQ